MPAQPFHDYLHHRLLDKGKALDGKTWEAYGRRLWDYARFLDANGLEWDRPSQSYGTSVVHTYRDWQAKDLRLQPGTINARLKVVADLYRWAEESGRIDSLPFRYVDVSLTRGHGNIQARSNQTVTTTPDLLLREWVKDPVFLTGEQVRAARPQIRSTTQRMLFDLMARVGLRSVEARTFPTKYVFDPARRVHLKPGSMIEVDLDPRDMQIKFGKPRTVHVPYSLMQDLHQYTKFERSRLLKQGEQSALLLTSHGN